MFLTNPNTATESKLPWGFFATIGWSVAITITALVIQDRVYWHVLQRVLFKPTALLQPLMLSSIASVIVSTVLTLAVAAAKVGRGRELVDYFALRRVAWKTASLWIVLGILAGSMETFTRHVTNSEGGTANLLAQDGLVLYLLTFAVFVPISEELSERGFLLTGLLETRFRDALAVPLAAAMWAVPHNNRTWQGFVALFLLGCLLGVMRKSCNSILPGCCVHSVLNFIAFGLVVMEI